MITSRMSRIDWLLATNGNPCGFFDSLFSDFLGPAAALAGGILFPEFAIPAEIAGGFLGGTAGGLLGGASPGQSLIQGAETGALAGATGALSGADFSPGNTPVPGGIFGGAGAGGVLGDVFGGPAAAPGAAPDVVPGGAGSVTPTATPAAAPTGSLTAPGGAPGAASLVGGLPNDPVLGGDAFLNQSGNTNFLGAAGGGGTSNISGLPTGGDTFAANPTGAGGLPGGGPSSFLSPGTDQALPGVAGGSSADIAPTGGGGGVSGFISKNWPALAGAGILGFEALSAKQPLPQEQALQANATQAAGQSAALEAPLQTGILPPGAQQAVSAATASSKAAAKSNFASLGLSGSTMETQQMQAIDRNAAAQTFQIADSLLAKGIDLSKLSAQDLTQLLDEQLKQDQQFTGALTAFSSGLAGGKLTA
jgi:hypothetical protein